MSQYTVNLTEEDEKFLDWYLKENPLRPEHTREMYPHLVATNFITGMRKRMMSEGKYCPRCEGHNGSNNVD